MDWVQKSAHEQARAIADGELCPVTLCERYLERIDNYDSQTRAYLHVDREGALARAKELRKKRDAGQSLGALGGVPVALKDLLVTRGMPTTAGSKMLEGWQSPYEATAVQRLREADAVILGKVDLDEFAMGSSSEHSALGACKNPWDLRRVPGGSSGGSAAAVAADLCALSLGTDTGGSIRQPASFCGILGIKPSYGRISRHGLIAYASSLDQIGPMCRYAEDAALALDLLCGRDPLDATSLPGPAPRFAEELAAGNTSDLSGLRIGIAKEMHGEGVDPQVESRVQEALQELVKAGATLVDISLPHTSHSLSAYYLIATAEASSNLARYDGVRYGMRASDKSTLDMYCETRAKGFGAEVKRRILLGTFALRAGYYDKYYRKAQEVRALIARDFARAFEKVDVIASPTSPTPAFLLGSKNSPMEMYQSDIFTLSCNLAGLPGMSMPCGFDDDGQLPIGMQVLAPLLEESRLLRVAKVYQAHSDWHLRRPTLEGAS